MAKCRGCHADILFIKTVGGRMTPVNADPVKFTYQVGGKDRIVTGNGEVITGVISEDGDEIGYVSHFSVCPKADQFRKR